MADWSEFNRELASALKANREASRDLWRLMAAFSVLVLIAFVVTI